MLAGPVKTVVLALLALLISAGHSVCAHVLAPSITATLAHESHAAMKHDGGHAGHAAGHGDVRHDAKHDRAPCGTDGPGCPHCDAANFYKAASAPDLAGSMPAPATLIAILRDDAQSSDERAASASFLTALRRRGPPGDTPVSLKTRLLN